MTAFALLMLSKNIFDSISPGTKPHPRRMAARYSALTVRYQRTVRTFAGREVFSSMRMSPRKTDLDFFADVPPRTLRGFSLHAEERESR